MTDTVDRATRSRTMARVRSQDSKAEMAVRRALHRAGLRYRLHARRLPGTPDLVLPRRNTVVFVHGCFWHRHPGCKEAAMPSSNSAYWAAKFERNVQRDRRDIAELRTMGWDVIVLWECEIDDGSVAALATELLDREHR